MSNRRRKELASATNRRSIGSATKREATGYTRNANVEFGREICGSLELAEQRERLVTNGIDGYTSGTFSGDLTRRYHGRLLASLKPPVGRTQLIAKLEETANYGGSD